MTFPLDPGLRAFQAKEAERALLADTPAQPVSPAGLPADDAEHATVTLPRPAHDGAPQPS
jgi:hypothetical protein